MFCVFSKYYYTTKYLVGILGLRSLKQTTTSKMSDILTLRNIMYFVRNTRCNILPVGFDEIIDNPDRTINLNKLTNVSTSHMLRIINYYYDDTVNVLGYDVPLSAQAEKLFDEMVDAEEVAKLQSLEQSRALGWLLHKLKCVPEHIVCRHGFHNPHSWRGDYFEAAFEPAENVSVGDMIDSVNTALRGSFRGYKGGHFSFNSRTPTHISEEGMDYDNTDWMSCLLDELESALSAESDGDA